MDVEIITLPYHLDRHRVGTGLGPARLLEAGMEAAASAVSAESEVGLGADTGNETGNIFALSRTLVERVRQSRGRGAFPLVLAGDCHNAIGVMSALSSSPVDSGRRGLVWLDAHGDANTPETSASGFFDGMALAVVLGWCWDALARSVPGFEPLDGEAVVHLGGRAFDPGEREAMAGAGVTVVDAATMHSADGAAGSLSAVDRLAAACDVVHVHLDLDVIDPADGVASGYATDGGPPLALLHDVFATLAASRKLVSASVCSYDPAFDADGRAARAAVNLVRTLLSTA